MRKNKKNVEEKKSKIIAISDPNGNIRELIAEINALLMRKETNSRIVENALVEKLKALKKAKDKVK